MKLHANNAHDASKELLRMVFASDYNHRRYRAGEYAFTYVYFSAELCRFYFEPQQRKFSTEMIKRYKTVDVDEVLTITARKYTFAQIAIGLIIARKGMSHREFFDIAREHFEWI